MITCIVNPSRCGSTWLQHIIDKHFQLTGLSDYSMEYEIIDHANGMKVMENPPTKNFLFKYQYLYANKPLFGADKYIVIDRRDLYAWCYSSYMSFNILTHMAKHQRYKLLTTMFLKVTKKL